MYPNRLSMSECRYREKGEKTVEAGCPFVRCAASIRSCRFKISAQFHAWDSPLEEGKQHVPSTLTDLDSTCPQPLSSPEWVVSSRGGGVEKQSHENSSLSVLEFMRERERRLSGRRKARNARRLQMPHYRSVALHLDFRLLVRDGRGRAATCVRRFVPVLKLTLFTRGCVCKRSSGVYTDRTCPRKPFVYACSGCARNFAIPLAKI